MRNPDRLDEFYDKLKEIHKKHFCDYRYLQLMLDFIGWIMQNKERDPFFVEEKECIEWLKEYVNNQGIFFKGYELYGDRKFDR